jgi:hypothetical protein
VVDSTMNNNPNDLVALWLHRSDGYECEWSDWRKWNFYNYGYIPYTVIDASIVTSTGMFQTHIDQRLAVPTDVTIELGATMVDTSTYVATANVCVEPTGAVTAMNLHFFNVLDHWPTSPTYYRNCVREGYRMGTITVGPGSCIGVQQQIVFDGDSLANSTDIKIAAMVEEPVAVAMGEVYQAAIINWPLASTGHPVFSSAFENGTLGGWSAAAP